MNLDMVAMGNPRLPFLAELFMNRLEAMVQSTFVIFRGFGSDKSTMALLFSKIRTLLLFVSK